MEYFRDIVIAAALCGVIVSLSPTGDQSTGKYVKYLASLLLLLVLLSPVARLRTSADEITDAVRGFFSATADSSATQSTYDAAIAMNTAALSDRIAASVCQSFDLASDGISVSVTVDTEDPAALTVTSVDVRINAETDTDAVRSYVQSLGFENCNVSKGE